MIKKVLFAIALIFFSTAFAFSLSDNIPERPNPPRLVNNLSKEFPDFITAAEERQLEQKLSSFANQTSNQIVIVIIDDLSGMEAWDYATKLGHKWGVGQAKFDNGVVILVKPTGGDGNRDLFIAVGYGLEGAIPDLTTKQIRENEMYPYFAKNRYFTALDKGTDVLMALAKGEFSSDEYGQKNTTKRLPFNFIFPLILIIIIIAVRARKNRNRNGGGLTMGGGFLPFGSFGGGGFGGGSFGGGASGGFGGFGGGGFGGGGSGGKW